MTATHSERERFIAEIIRRAPAADLYAATRLMRYSSTIHRLSNQHPLTFAEERKLERVSLKARDLAFDVRCTAKIENGTLSILLPDKTMLFVPRI